MKGNTEHPQPKTHKRGKVLKLKEKKEESEKGYKLAIKENNVGVNGNCPICGIRTNPNIGVELFLANTWDEVCHRCGEKHAPELMRLLEFWKLVEETAFADRDNEKRMTGSKRLLEFGRLIKRTALFIPFFSPSPEFSEEFEKPF